MTERLEEILKESPFNQHTEEFLIKLEDMNEITKIVQELEELNRILSSDKSMFIEELVREQQQNKRYKQALEDTKEFLERMEKGQSLGRSHYVGYNLIEALNTINKALEREG